MKLRNVLIVVKDIEKSKAFYKDLFGLDAVLDNDGESDRSRHADVMHECRKRKRREDEMKESRRIFK